MERSVHIVPQYTVCLYNESVFINSFLHKPLARDSPELPNRLESCTDYQSL